MKKEYKNIINIALEHGLLLFCDRTQSDNDLVLYLYPEGYEDSRDDWNVCWSQGKMTDVEFYTWMFGCIHNHISSTPTKYDDLTNVLNMTFNNLLYQYEGYHMLYTKSRDADQIIEVTLKSEDNGKVVFKDVYEITPLTLDNISNDLYSIILNMKLKDEKRA